ncbi:MAG: hypothetical protein NVSMB62_13000 [Acidobacteriaceae bacterium]
MLGKEHLLGDYVLWAYFTARGERVFGGDDGTDDLRAKDFDDEMRLLYELVDADGDVHAGLDGWTEFADARCVQLDGDSGVAILKGAEKFGKAVREDGLGRTEGESAGWFTAGLDGVAGLFGQRKQAVGVGEEVFAGRGELDAARETIEQRHSELLLQRLNLGGDAGLRIMQDTCGAGEAAFANDGGEGAELAKVEHGSEISRCVSIEKSDWLYQFNSLDVMQGQVRF